MVGNGYLYCNLKKAQNKNTYFSLIFFVLFYSHNIPVFENAQKFVIYTLARTKAIIF